MGALQPQKNDMPKFDVDEDLAAWVERLAKPKPFEHLSFNNALRRVLTSLNAAGNPNSDLEALLAESMANYKKIKKQPSPNAKEWADSIPSLKGKLGLNNWKSICDFLEIETGGDSARRRLQSWVKENHPNWPQVPEINSD